MIYEYRQADKNNNYLLYMERSQIVRFLNSVPLSPAKRHGAMGY